MRKTTRRFIVTGQCSVLNPFSLITHRESLILESSHRESQNRAGLMRGKGFYDSFDAVPRLFLVLRFMCLFLVIRL
jgi:hypothetical protein